MIFWIGNTAVVVEADHDAPRGAISLDLDWLSCDSVRVEVSTDIKARMYWIAGDGERSRPLTDVSELRAVLDRVRELRRVLKELL
jgi:hypothetical protein